ncbi:MAG: hypothetical protein Q9186_007074 [Xanthomendoza sp. 1 TL-2023]
MDPLQDPPSIRYRRLLDVFGLGELFGGNTPCKRSNCLTQNQVSSVIYGAILTAAVQMGLGKHPYAIDPTKVSKTLKLYIAAVPFGLITLSLPTLAIAICLNNLIVPTKRQLYILYFFPTLQIVMAVVGIVLIFTQCKPQSALWSFQPGARCLDKSVVLGYVYLMTGTTIRGYPPVGSVFIDYLYVAFVDLFLAIVPLMAFWQLQIKPKAKIMLCLLMSTTAISAAICAFVRIAYVASLADIPDYTYASIHHTLWAVIEGNVIIIAACLPGLRPFVKYVRTRDFVKNSPSLPSHFVPARLRKTQPPPPLALGHKTSQHKLSDASSSLPSPLSARRMEPRPSGSVSGSLQAPSHKVYRLSSLERIESKLEVPDERIIKWQPGFGSGAEDMAETTNGEEGETIEEKRNSVGSIEAKEGDQEIEEQNDDDEPASIEVGEQTEDFEEMRGRAGRRETREIVEEVDENMIESSSAVGEDERRESQVQELREILEEGRASARQSWIEQIRERVDKRMTL